MRIRDGFKAIPAALQRQILRRGLMGCAFLLFSVVFLLMGYDALLVLPGVGFMLFSFASAVWLFHIATKSGMWSWRASAQRSRSPFCSSA